MSDDIKSMVTDTSESNKERWEFSKEIGKLCVRKIVEKIDDGFLLARWVAHFLVENRPSAIWLNSCIAQA